MTNHLYDGLFAQHSANEACFLLLDEVGQPSEISYRAFVERAAQIAHVLAGEGILPGDRVMVQAPKCSEMLALYAATIQVGAVFLPLNTAYKLDELAYFIADAEPGLIICTDEAVKDLEPLVKAQDTGLLTLNADGSGSLTRGMAGKPTYFPPAKRSPNDLAALLYTSGTTGRSKGAMLTHDNLLSNARVLTELWQITKDDTLIHALPIFHTHGLFVAINTALVAGARVRFMPSFNLDRIIDAMPLSTLLMGVPTFYTRLLNDARLNRDLVQGMRLFVSGSAPLLAETHEAFVARTNQHILERYGMTETNMIASNPYDGERRAGTVGFPLSGVEVRITDTTTGAPVRDGDIGMIEVRGPNVFKGYWRMPEKTAEELRDDGFFITGDLGQFSADGYLSIVGREKDLIISGGYNVYPKEIEDLLNDINGIDESAVFGVPHYDFGEAIIAAIVCEQGVGFDEAAVRETVAQKLARFKHPREYYAIDALPRNTMGKVQKNLLREKFLAATRPVGPK